MNGTVLSIKDLSIRLGNKEVLDRVSLDLKPGQLVGLIGPAGAGKTVLLKVIAGLISGYQGSCLLNTTRQPAVGMSFQNNALFDFLSVFENIAFPLREQQLDSPENITKRVTAILQEVGLAESADLFPRELSGGMQRRVGIARALVVKPAVVLFDDPSAGLDPVTSASIFRLIHDITQKEQAATLVVSSDVTSLCHWSERLILLEQGHIIFNDLPERASKSPQQYVRQFVTGQE